MNNDIFESAFSEIDDELIAEAKSPTIRIAARRKKILISTIAACVAAVLVSIPSIKVLSDLNSNNYTTSDDTEIIYEEEIVYEQTQSNTNNSTDGNSSIVIEDGIQGGTNGFQYNELGANGDCITITDLYVLEDSSMDYTTAYVPDIKYLYINPVPEQQNVTIYERYYENQLSEDEIYSISDKIFPNLETALNTTLPQKEIDIHSDRIEISLEYTNNWIYDVSFVQRLNKNIIGFSSKLDSIDLYGKKFSIDYLHTDDEFMNVMSSFKQDIYNMFDVQFNDIRIECLYDEKEHTSDPFFVTVYFYNQSDHPLNTLKNHTPYSDYILAEFVNIAPSKEPGVNNDGIYLFVSLYHCSHRTKSKTDLRSVREEKLFSIKKAEEYLKKGYVVRRDDHITNCPVCMVEEKSTTFTGYDYVSFEYIGGYAIGDLTIPYYVFYKKTGIAENGNMIFSKAYVPAVEVEGYEEYFINKHSNH